MKKLIHRKNMHDVNFVDNKTYNALARSTMTSWLNFLLQKHTKSSTRSFLHLTILQNQNKKHLRSSTLIRRRITITCEPKYNFSKFINTEILIKKLKTAAN